MINWIKSLFGMNKQEVPTGHVPPQLQGVEVSKGENKVAAAEPAPAPKKKRAPRKSTAKKTATTKKTTTKKKAAPKKEADSSWKVTK
jgi:hypothetical protein